MPVCLEINCPNEVLEGGHAHLVLKYFLQVFEVNFLREKSVQLWLVGLAVESLRHALFVCFLLHSFINLAETLVH